MGVLGQCASLAHLNLHHNIIGDVGARRLVGVLGHYLSLAHLDLSYNKIGNEGPGNRDSGIELRGENGATRNLKR